MMPTHPTVTERFTWHKPDDRQGNDIAMVRTMCLDLAQFIEQTYMEPRCRALAITKLEEVSMWANKGIVLLETMPAGSPDGPSPA